MFSGCSKLKTVVIPSSVRDVGHDAFNGCSAMTVYFGGDQTSWNTMIKQDGNTALSAATVKYYSETEEAGKWHFGADGKPELW